MHEDGKIIAAYGCDVVWSRTQPLVFTADVRVRCVLLVVTCFDCVFVEVAGQIGHSAQTCELSGYYMRS